MSRPQEHTDIDYDKIDDRTLALLHLVASRGPFGARAWKSFDLETLNRLQAKGYIADLQSKSPSVVLSEQGQARAKELFEQFFAK